ncbi:MAG: DUF3792 family protein [Bacilli bacterium]|nr:DUF3792 family protein [Bacilli bacterium]
MEVLVSFIMGLFNLIGMNSSLSKIIILIINLALFFIYGLSRGKVTHKKGLIEGLITGGILVAILFVISLIFFHSAISIATIFYYLALIFATIVGATVGKNTKKDSTV